MSIRINPLSVAKGHAHSCELCRQKATLLCSGCRVTFYCSKSHMSADALGIHNKICSLLGALRSLRPTLGSEEERQKRQLTVAMSHHALIDLCKHEAQRWIIKGQHELAVPAALQALRFSVEVYGKNRIDLVPSYLLLAEANLGLGRLKAAEEQLLYANWAVLQSAAACPAATHSLLRRHFGNLYSAQGKLDAALKSYALDVYHASVHYGPEHIDASIGIHLMGSTFLRIAQQQQSNSAAATSAAAAAATAAPTAGGGVGRPAMECALALYDRYVDIWYKFLLHLRSRQDESISDYLHDHQLATATAALLHVVVTRSARLGRQHIATAEAVYVLGLLKLMSGRDVDADWLLRRAEDAYTAVLGADHDSTAAIRRAREEMGDVRMQRADRMKDWQDGEPEPVQDGQQQRPGQPMQQHTIDRPSSAARSEQQNERAEEEEKEQVVFTADVEQERLAQQLDHEGTTADEQGDQSPPAAEPAAVDAVTTAAAAEDGNSVEVQPAEDAVPETAVDVQPNADAAETAELAAQEAEVADAGGAQELEEAETEQVPPVEEEKQTISGDGGSGSTATDEAESTAAAGSNIAAFPDGEAASKPEQEEQEAESAASADADADAQPAAAAVSDAEVEHNTGVEVQPAENGDRAVPKTAFAVQSNAEAAETAESAAQEAAAADAGGAHMDEAAAVEVETVQVAAVEEMEGASGDGRAASDEAEQNAAAGSSTTTSPDGEATSNPEQEAKEPEPAASDNADADVQPAAVAVSDAESEHNAGVEVQPTEDSDRAVPETAVAVLFNAEAAKTAESAAQEVESADAGGAQVEEDAVVEAETDKVAAVEEEKEADNGDGSGSAVSAEAESSAAAGSSIEAFPDGEAASKPEQEEKETESAASDDASTDAAAVPDAEVEHKAVDVSGSSSSRPQSQSQSALFMSAILATADDQ